MMYEEYKLQPIVAAGRGGSGTRLLSQMLQSLGVFMGNELNESEDSVEWVDLVYELVLSKLESDTYLFSAQIKEKFEKKAIEILSLGGQAADALWGWKLPETVMCTPEIFTVFPKAKLVHLVRHPITSSLRRTHLTSRTDNPLGVATLKAAYSHIGWTPTRIDNNPNYLNNAATWLYQIHQIQTFASKTLGPDQYIVLRYEDLCQSPRHTQSTLANFIGATELSLDTVVPDQNRISHFDSRDLRAREVWKLCQEYGAIYGYEL